MGDYHFSFFYSQICFNVSILLVNERFLQVSYTMSHYLCTVEIAKGVDSHRFTFEPGLRQPLE
jgi:hypothetical protein